MKDSRKLKNVEEIVQHFNDLCGDYVPKRNIPNFFEINYKGDREKGKRKTVVFTNLRKTSTKCGVVLCVGKNAGKNTIYIKKTYE